MISERQKMKEAYMKNLRAGTMDNVEVCKLMKVDELFRDKLLSIVTRNMKTPISASKT